ncbi:class I SAM-dependent methyltransferase [Paenibacillus swuensis]|uniref:class I SAM-dependent methyltransferase n=1 Tax=Paenibacillus swuensis TaxID=1178515 RepID=UPI001E34CB6D|nr:class I SAM-dependent methyltransferase [Paenibacillus swuensis]
MEVKARQLSLRLGVNYVPRRESSVPRLRSQHGAEALWIVSERELKYMNVHDAVLFFHPSTGILRVKRMLKGEEDTLVRLAGIVPGTSVIDCTAGLASDSIVMSYASGETGKVTAIESDLNISTIIDEGLQTYVSEVPELNEAMRRIQVRRMNHLDYLRSLSDDSVDIIYFDPMFRNAIAESNSISPLRGTANDAPLTTDAIREAARVARHRLVMKEHRDSEEFDRLGFSHVHRTYSKIAYGVINL